jgi:hypothetical protein
MLQHILIGASGEARLKNCSRGHEDVSELCSMLANNLLKNNSIVRAIQQCLTSSICSTLLQWRAKSATSLGNFSYEMGKGGWGWSWMDRWIAARPWEPRSLIHPENPKKTQAKNENSNANQSALKLQGSISLSNNTNDRKVPKKKPSPSPSPTDHKKPVSKEQRAKVVGTPPKVKAKDIKGSHGKQVQQKQQKRFLQ